VEKMSWVSMLVLDKIARKTKFLISLGMAGLSQFVSKNMAKMSEVSEGGK